MFISSHDEMETLFRLFDYAAHFRAADLILTVGMPLARSGNIPSLRFSSFDVCLLPPFL